MKAVPQNGSDDSPNELRVLPWVGCSSFATLLILSSMACSRPHLGGLREDRAGVKSLLSALVSLANVKSFKIRVDLDVEHVFSMSGTVIALSRGCEVEVPCGLEFPIVLAMHCAMTWTNTSSCQMFGAFSEI
jgi:hypothetical protein